MEDGPKPHDHAEEVSIFRAEVIGHLTRLDLGRGELREALRKLAKERFRPPGAERTHCYSAATLERWYYRYKKSGLEGLRPRRRSDRGRGRELTTDKRELLLAIRREHPAASVPLILRTLEIDGRLERGEVSASTVRRLFREQGLDRIAARDGDGRRMRLRWQAERPGALWHGDVCHGHAIQPGGTKRVPVRIHALMDDASRYVVALEVHHTERELDMLELFVRALRRHGKPEALFLDNGSTYRGQQLQTACARLGITLVHARPYDAPARGKMERFWRTLRQGCLDFTGPLATRHDLEVRLLAFLDQHYHRAPHASLMGRSPATVYAEGKSACGLGDVEEKSLRDALTVKLRRRVRRDSTLAIDGADYECDQAFLAGRLVTVFRCLVDRTEAPWIEHEGKRLVLHLVDPVRNARRKRVRLAQVPEPKTPFDPPRALLDRAIGRKGTSR